MNEAVPPDDGEVVDVLVVYAPITRGLQGGHRAMRAVIDRDVAMTNEAYRVGGVAQRINLVGAVEVGHQGAPAWLESSTGGLHGTLLDHLRNRDGVLDEVHALRDSYAADLVLMHTGDLIYVFAGARGGIAFAPDFGPSEDSASLGFSISSSRAFAHELGHNMGLLHERERDNSNLPFPYSHGYLLRETSFGELDTIGTIMATVGDKVPRFSNPRQRWRSSGEALGVPGDEPSDSADGPADAVRSLNGTRRAVSNFRASAGRCAYSLSPELPVLPAAGGEFRVRVETAPGCEWTALSDGGFLTVMEGSGGVGGGEIVYRVPANEGWEREAALLIAAEVYSVRQQGVRPYTPICERTPIVSQAVSAAVGRPCAEVAASDVVSVGSLHFYLYHESELPKPGDFAGLSSLSTLSIVWNNEYPGHLVLEPGVFAGLSNLRHLQLVRFASFKPGLFDGLDQLVDLGLQDTEALVVAPDLFDGLSNLRRLGLQDSGIRTLVPDVFSELSNLTTLYLASNPITELVPGVFNGLPKLRFLQAANMQLKTLRPGVFDGLANMVYVGLSENRLTALHPGVFDGLANLEYLYLENNLLKSLPLGVFDEMANLKRLRLESNHIAALSPGAFDGLPKLGSLRLWDNRLATLPVGAFDGLPSLSRVYLSGNRLATLPNGLFAKTTQLYHLDLSDNQLTDLPGGLFAGTRLYELNLSGNQLTTLPSSLFSGVRVLNRLDLASNLLRALPAGLLAGLDFEDQMEFLALEDNPGAPFPFTAEFVRPPAVGSAPGAPVEIALEVAEGAPFNIRIGLTATNGSLSSNEASIAKGSTRGEALSVTPRDGASVTLAMTDVANDASRAIPLVESCGHGIRELWELCHSGFRTAAGPPLVLYGLPDQTLVERAAVKFHLPSAFPDFGDGTSYAVEFGAPAVAGAVVAGGVMTVVAGHSGETTLTVTATSAGGRTETRRFTVTVEQPVSSFWGGWRSVLLQQRPSAEDGDRTLEQHP